MVRERSVSLNYIYIYINIVYIHRGDYYVPINRIVWRQTYTAMPRRKHLDGPRPRRSSRIRFGPDEMMNGKKDNIQ